MEPWNLVVGGWWLVVGVIELQIFKLNIFIYIWCEPPGQDTIL